MSADYEEMTKGFFNPDAPVEEAEEVVSEEDTEELEAPDETEDETPEEDSSSEEYDEEEDDEDEEGEGEGGEEEEEEEKPRRRSNKKSAPQRIAELTKARRAAEEELEALKASLAEPKTETPKEPTKTDGPDLSDLKKPNPVDYKFGELDEAYLSDLTDHKMEISFRKKEFQFDQKRAQKEAKAAEAKQLADLEAKFVDNVVNVGLKEFNDFEDVVIEGGKAGNYQLTPTLVSLIAESEAGAKIMYQFASDPEEAEKVSKMPVYKQAAYFGRLEARYISSNEDAGRQGQRKLSKAPKPLKRKPRGNAVGKKTDPATSDFAAFEKLINS